MQRRSFILVAFTKIKTTKINSEGLLRLSTKFSTPKTTSHMVHCHDHSHTHHDNNQLWVGLYKICNTDRKHHIDKLIVAK